MIDLSHRRPGPGQPFRRRRTFLLQRYGISLCFGSMARYKNQRDHGRSCRLTAYRHAPTFPMFISMVAETERHIAGFGGVK